MSNVSESIIAQINQQTAEAAPNRGAEHLKKGDKALLQTDTLGKCAPSSKLDTSAPKTNPVLIQPKKASESTNYLKAEVAAFVAAFLSDKNSVALNNSSLSQWTTLINTSSKCAIETTNALISKQKIQLAQYHALEAEEEHDEHKDKILGDWTLGLSIAIAVIAIGSSVLSGGLSLTSLGAVDFMSSAADTATEAIGKRVLSFITRNAIKYGTNMLMGGTMGFVMSSPKLVEALQKRRIGHALEVQANTEQQVGILQASFTKQNEFLQYDGTQASMAGKFIQQMIQQLTGPITNIGDVVHAVQAAVSKV